jgi:hypothetical protein
MSVRKPLFDRKKGFPGSISSCRSLTPTKLLPVMIFTVAGSVTDSKFRQPWNASGSILSNREPGPNVIRLDSFAPSKFAGPSISTDAGTTKLTTSQGAGNDPIEILSPPIKKFAVTIKFEPIGDLSMAALTDPPGHGGSLENSRSRRWRLIGVPGIHGRRCRGPRRASNSRPGRRAETGSCTDLTLVCSRDSEPSGQKVRDDDQV